MFMISYDFNSFFTNIPLSETVDLAANAIFESNTGLDLKLSKIKLRELFYFATSHTHFLFNGSFYDQVDGAAMGSPLAPMWANFFMGHYEKLRLNNYTGPKVLYYSRYVDIICCFKNYNDACLFLSAFILAIPTLSSLWKQNKTGGQLLFCVAYTKCKATLWYHLIYLFIYLFIYLSTRVERLSRGLLSTVYVV